VPRNTSKSPSRGPEKAPAGSFHIDADLKEFLESGVAVIVSTGDGQRRPHVMYGWGPRVRDDSASLEVFVDKPRADQTIANATKNGQIAVTVAHPVSYRSVQLKGTFIGNDEATAADRAWIASHHEAFIVSTSLVGDPPEAIRGMWTEEFVKLSMTVDRAFDQTPGPEAARPL
jgi:hypothetical protein